METITRNLRDLPQNDRTALERVIGHGLSESQQVIVNVVDLDPGCETSPAVATGAEIPKWRNVYEGLDEEEIDRLDASINQRANLTRDLA